MAPATEAAGEGKGTGAVEAEHDVHLFSFHSSGSETLSSAGRKKSFSSRRYVFVPAGKMFRRALTKKNTLHTQKKKPVFSRAEHVSGVSMSVFALTVSFAGQWWWRTPLQGEVRS